MMREPQALGVVSEYSGKACSSAPGVRKKFGCEPAASTRASAAKLCPSAVVTVRVVASTDATSAIFTSTLGSSWKSLRKENATSLEASCDVATW